MHLLGKLLFCLFFTSVFDNEHQSDGTIRDAGKFRPDIHQEIFPQGKDNQSPDNDEIHFPDRPLQIVRPDLKHKSLEIVEENMKYLHRINGSVMTVAVVGKFHSGKSFLMNQLMQKSSGFGIGSKVTPETMGIWIWGNPLQMNDEKKEWILFLDTEGFAANNVSENYDAKIFAVASLLSSKLIYNSVKIIDQSDIDYLELLSRRTQLFAHKSRMLPRKNPDGTDTFVNDELLKFPHLLWVIQDFVQDTAGEECKTWLMKMLNTHTREEENYSISLKDIFPSVDCHTLFIPSAEKALLHDLSKAKDNDLTRDYRNDRNNLLEKIRVSPSETHTKFYTGTQVAAVLRTLVNGANMGSMQNIPNRWDAFLESLKQSSVDDCFKFYLSYLQTDVDFANGEPKPEKDLELLYQNSRDKAMDLLRHFLQGLDKSLKESTDDLEELFKKHHAQMFNENTNRIRIKIIAISQSIQKEIYDDFKSLQLPMLSKELKRHYEGMVNTMKESFVKKINNLVSREALSSNIEEIQKSLSLNYDSTQLSNREKIEKIFAQNSEKVLSQAFIQVKIDSARPMLPEACYMLLNELIGLSVEQFHKKADKYLEEKDIYESVLGKLKGSLHEQMAMILRDNEQAIHLFLEKEANRLVNQYDESTSKYVSKFPMEPEILNDHLNTDSQRFKEMFTTDYSSYSTSPFYKQGFNKLVQEIGNVTERYQDENFKTYRHAVDEQLSLAKRVILVSAKNYGTQFSFTQYAKTICSLHLNEGKAKDWSVALKERIIYIYLREDKELKEQIDSRAGIVSNILGFFQWLWYWLFG